MAEKIYKCKKCQAEFTDLSEYRAHNLKCKADEETVEETAEKPAKKKKDNSKLIEQAKQFNTCRGYYEGNKDEICKNYNKCSECWNEFKG